MHTMCNHTWYGEIELITNRKLEFLAEVTYALWYSSRSVPKCIYIDSEFNRHAFLKFLAENGVEKHVLPPRRHNKLCIERNKSASSNYLYASYEPHIFRRLLDGLPKSLFFGNLFYGSNSLSLFEFCRGYTPKIAEGIDYL